MLLSKGLMQQKQLNIMHECYICLETEADADKLVFCRNHQFHIDCLKLWAGTKTHRMQVCNLCHSLFKHDYFNEIYDVEESPDVIKNLKIHMIKIIKDDDAINLRIEGHDLRKFPYILKLAMKYKSMNIMKKLKEREFITSNQMWDYYSDFFLFPNHETTCWILNEFDLPKQFVVPRNHIVEVLMQHSRYCELSGILIFNYLILANEERVRIGTFLFDGMILKKTELNHSDPFHYIASLAAFVNSHGCWILTEFFPRCSMNSMKYAKNLRSLEFIFQKCINCKKYHYWDILMTAITIGNKDLVRASLNFEAPLIQGIKPIKGYLVPVPFDSFMKVFLESPHRNQMLSIINLNYRFRNSRKWKKALRANGIKAEKVSINPNKFWI